MTAPFVGPPTVSGAGCAYAVDIHTSSCSNPTTVHLLVASVAWGHVSLESCDVHAGFGRATGEVLGEHEWRPECTVTDCWDVP